MSPRAVTACSLDQRLARLAAGSRCSIGGAPGMRRSTPWRWVPSSRCSALHTQSMRPPVAHTPRVVALSGDRIACGLAAVDGDRARHRARDFVARRDPVLVRRARRRPDQIHRQLDGLPGFAAQQCGRIVVGLPPPAHRHPVGLQRLGRLEREVDRIRADTAGSSGSAASKSTSAMVGMSGPHSSALIHAVSWLGSARAGSTRRSPAARRRSRSTSSRSTAARRRRDARPSSSAAG